MSMQFSNEAEAFVAIASLVLGVDKVGTLTERNYLFSQLSKMEPFEGLDEKQFIGLFSKVNESLFSDIQFVDEFLEPAGITIFSDAVKAVIPNKKLNTAFQMACELACVDGLVRIEQKLLLQLGQAFGKTQQSVYNTLRASKAKYQ